MTVTYTSHRVAGYLTLVVLGLVGALVSGRPEPAILATPFALVLVGGLTLTRPPVVSGALELAQERAMEGDDVPVTITVTPADAAVAIEVADRLGARREQPARDGVVPLVVTPARWGAYPIGRVSVRALDDMGLFWAETAVRQTTVLRVYPSAERLRHGIAAADLQPFVGRHPSRARADGLEFADLRPYVAGDRARSVNWRATARRGALWVNERHPDRSSDVVLLVDTLDSGRHDRAAVLDRTVRATSAVAEAYQRTHDRVALLTFGGHVRWLTLRSGRPQLMRIVDALLDTEMLLTGSWQGGTHLPIGSLPPRALLLALTPLDHDAVVETLLDLRARGFDVAVLATVPVRPTTTAAAPDATGPGLVAPGAGGRRRARDDRRGSDAAAAAIEAAGERLDVLLRDARRLRLERLGVVVADTSAGVAAAVEEVELCRRRMPRVRV